MKLPCPDPWNFTLRFSMISGRLNSVVAAGATGAGVTGAAGGGPYKFEGSPT